MSACGGAVLEEAYPCALAVAGRGGLPVPQICAELRGRRFRGPAVGISRAMPQPSAAARCRSQVPQPGAAARCRVACAAVKRPTAAVRAPLGPRLRHILISGVIKRAIRAGFCPERGICCSESPTRDVLRRPWRPFRAGGRGRPPFRAGGRGPAIAASRDRTKVPAVGSTGPIEEVAAGARMRRTAGEGVTGGPVERLGPVAHVRDAEDGDGRRAGRTDRGWR